MPFMYSTHARSLNKLDVNFASTAITASRHSIGVGLVHRLCSHFCPAFDVDAWLSPDRFMKRPSRVSALLLRP